MEIQSWLDLIVRMVHVIVGIMWIGQTYLFHWMEKTFEPPQGGVKGNISGELWMVHGGGFYFVQKQKWPELMPRKLHWFKWESAMTWISGMFLLAIVYWAGGPLLEYGSAVSRPAGIAVSVGVLILGRVLYDLIWKIPIAKKSELAGAGFCWLIILAIAYCLDQRLSNRAAYLHAGAMLGTIMVSNVWMIILPNQRKMMAITEAGGPPQPELGARAHRASKHNTFMSVPVIFLMISGHFPGITFGLEYNWMILGILVLAGWGAAKVIRDYL